MGLPDMRLPIQYALGYPDRYLSNFPRLDFSTHTQLTFEKPDTKTFRNLALAYEALRRGGNTPCVINAANEVAVAAFLDEKIRFGKMPQVIEFCMEKVSFIKEPAYDDYVFTDDAARKYALEVVDRLA